MKHSGYHDYLPHNQRLTKRNQFFSKHLNLSLDPYACAVLMRSYFKPRYDFSLHFAATPLEQLPVGKKLTRLILSIPQY